MNEASKIRKRLQANGTFDKYIKGLVLDVGCGDDPIVPKAYGWDLKDGDAQRLATVPNNSVDTVFSAHCLEHLRDPHTALFHWWRVLKPGGYLVVQVPDGELYEQGIWPSIFNPDHKNTFSISSDKPGCPRNVNVNELLERLPNRRVIYVATVDTNYDYVLQGHDPVLDQTLTDVEAAIEFVVQKGPARLPLRSDLKNVVLCAKCGKANFTVIGETNEPGKFQLTCGTCGYPGLLEAQK